MPRYKLIAIIPTYLSYEVDAPDEITAIAAVNEDTVEYTEKFIDYDSSVLEVVSIDGEYT